MSGGYTLYGRIGSGNAVCEATLALTGLPHTLVDLERWRQDAPPAALLAVSPLAEVPALVLPDGSVMTESAAITLYLADLAPESGLAPPVTHPQRARYLRWMLYLAAQTYPTALRLYYPERFTSEPFGAEAVKAAAAVRYAFEWSVFAEALGSGPFILGSKMSAVDLYAAMLASWALDVEALVTRHPNLRRLCEMTALEPAVQKVWLRHGI
jgi:glutathione S-transferase